MLRSKAAASQPDDFTSGDWRPVIGDDAVDASAVERVLLCSGKITWDLVAETAEARGHADRDRPARAAVPTSAGRDQCDPRRVPPNATEVRWVQDEPANQGPWPHLALHFPGNLERNLPISLVRGLESSTTAVGSHNRHVDEQEALMAQAFA